jgi:hypothetical protein
LELPGVYSPIHVLVVALVIPLQVTVTCCPPDTVDGLTVKVG